MLVAEGHERLAPRAPGERGAPSRDDPHRHPAQVRGIGWHRLRANVAALVEWLRICAREGWLGSARSARRNHGRPERSFRETGQRIASKLGDMSVRMGVAAAYGEQAERRGFGQRTPPSRRPGGAPPGQTTLDLGPTT